MTSSLSHLSKFLVLIVSGFGGVVSSFGIAASISVTSIAAPTSVDTIPSMQARTVRLRRRGCCVGQLFHFRGRHDALLRKNQGTNTHTKLSILRNSNLRLSRPDRDASTSHWQIFPQHTETTQLEYLNPNRGTQSIKLSNSLSTRHCSLCYRKWYIFYKHASSIREYV